MMAVGGGNWPQAQVSHSSLFDRIAAMKADSERLELMVLAATAFAWLLFVALHASAQTNEKALIQDSEEYAVYSALLNAEYASAKGYPLLVVVNKT